jgi:hypothetical protein
MSNAKKRKDKFRYDETQFVEERAELEKFRKESLPIIPKTNPLSCGKGHALSDKNWSNVRSKYYCPVCLKEFAKDETIK